MSEQATSQNFGSPAALTSISSRGITLWGLHPNYYMSQIEVGVDNGEVLVFSSFADDHAHASFGTNSDERFHLYPLVGWRGEFAFLGEQGQDDFLFCQGEATADAGSRTCAEGGVGVRSNFLLVLLAETLWAERFWFFKPAWVVVLYIGADKDHGSFAYVISTKLYILHRLPTENPGGWIDAQCLFDDLVDVLQAG